MLSGFSCVHDLHLVDAAVAGHAADAGADVRGVIEVDVVRRACGRAPSASAGRSRRCRGSAARSGLSFFDQLVAVHADLRRRHARDRPTLDRRVAVAAVDLHVAGVQLVAVRHRLGRLVADVVYQGEKKYQTRHRDGRRRAPRRGQQRQPIGPAGEDLRQRCLPAPADLGEDQDALPIGPGGN